MPAGSGAVSSVRYAPLLRIFSAALQSSGIHKARRAGREGVASYPAWKFVTSGFSCSLPGGQGTGSSNTGNPGDCAQKTRNSLKND